MFEKESKLYGKAYYYGSNPLCGIQSFAGGNLFFNFLCVVKPQKIFATIINLMLDVFLQDAVNLMENHK